MNALAITALVVAATLFRLIPHPPNFTPIIGMALFSGWMMTDRRLAYAVPLVAMVLSDAVLGFHSLAPFVYVSIAIATFLGDQISGGFKKTVLASLAGSSVFFVITNFAVWSSTSYYAKSLSGLIECYVLAIPFFGNTIVSTLLTVFSLQAAYQLSKSGYRSLFSSTVGSH